MRRRTKPIGERFWRFVHKTDGCWTWTGARNSAGYGHLRIHGRNVLAHRLSLTLAGRDPGDLCALHRCDNPKCVRPDHLFVGTVGDNNRDCQAKGRGGDRRNFGEKNGRAVLTAAIVRAMRVHARMGVPRYMLAEAFGVDRRLASDAISGRTWRGVV